jgi:hypothetical protein
MTVLLTPKAWIASRIKAENFTVQSIISHND